MLCRSLVQSTLSVTISITVTTALPVTTSLPVTRERGDINMSSYNWRDGEIHEKLTII
jgi:hypothetical protein